LDRPPTAFHDASHHRSSPGHWATAETETTADLASVVSRSTTRPSSATTWSWAFCSPHHLRLIGLQNCRASRRNRNKLARLETHRPVQTLHSKALPQNQRRIIPSGPVGLEIAMKNPQFETTLAEVVANPNPPWSIERLNGWMIAKGPSRPNGANLTFLTPKPEAEARADTFPPFMPTR
jgi:hypothetical protein